MNAIREWAKDQGVEVADRGRLPKSLVVDYLMAHPAEARSSSCLRALRLVIAGGSVRLRLALL